MGKTSEKRGVGSFILLCAMVYFTSYISRINFSATLVEVINSGFSKRDIASLALTINSVAYGVGQIISGWLGAKYRPQNIIFSGFVITAFINICVSFIPDKSVLIVPLWTVNGFAHALMWPPLIAVMARYLDEADYQRGCVNVSIASSVGSIAVYLASPVIISFMGLRYVFALCGLFAAAMAVFWKLMFKKMTGEGGKLYGAKGFVKKSENGSVGNDKKSAVFFVVLGAVMLGIIIQGVLRDGVTTWMPSYVSETFNLSGEISILTGVALPIFSMISFKVAAFVYNKLIRNELLCAASMFAVSAVCATVLAVFSSSNVIVSMLFSAFITGCMHGVNFVLICMVPPYLSKYGKVSVFSGLLNSCTYVGSAVSTYGFAVYSQSAGWQATIVLWAVFSLCGALLCLGFSKVWKKFIRK